MLKSMPRLRFASGHDLIFQEGAIAAFEIKTSINGQKTIADIGKNIRSVMNLSPTSLRGARMGDLSWKHARILTAVLTYDGAELPKIAGWFEKLPTSDRPDLYLDLSKGILLKNDGSFGLPIGNGSSYLTLENASVGLARFLTILAQITGVVQTREVKWEDYIG